MNRMSMLMVPLAIAALAACSNLSSQQQRAFTGGAVGAAGGAVVGALAGAPLTGALIGGAGGAAVGALINHDAFK
jgi:osmotically inducible lipoprotein OsmB